MTANPPDSGGQDGSPAERRNRRWLLWITATFVAGFIAVLLITILDERNNGGETTDAPAIGAEVPGESHAEDGEGEDEDGLIGDPDFTAGDEGQDAGAGPSGPPPSTGEERTAALTAQGFIVAIDDRDARAICRALTPEAANRLELPETGNNCATSVEASIGFADPRGFPVWESSNPAGPISAELDEEATRATVVLTVATRYADGREPTVEDDIIYLVRPTDSDPWQVSGFGTTLLRAIGTGDIPPSALAPPAGF